MWPAGVLLQALPEQALECIFTQLASDTQRHLAQSCTAFRAMWLMTGTAPFGPTSLRWHWREEQARRAAQFLADGLHLEPMERLLDETEVYERVLLLHVRGFLILGVRELAFICQQDSLGMLLVEDDFANLAATAIADAVTHHRGDRDFRYAFLTLRISHYRAAPLPEADVQRLSRLVSDLPRLVTDELRGTLSTAFEAVCWLRLASTSECVLPISWQVPHGRVFTERARLGQLADL